MLDIENLWTSESAVENLRSLTAEFYNFMCATEVLPIEEIKRLDEKRDFAFICKCGKTHTEHGRIWSLVATTLKTRTPAEDHPEFEKYELLRKEFMNEVEHIKIRDYAEPFLRASDEGVYIEAAITYQQKKIDDFMQKVCSSKMTCINNKTDNTIVSYYCEKHEANHYINPQQNNHFRSLISGAHVPEEYVPFLCKLSQRIVLRDTSAVFRDWAEANPQTKMDNPAYLSHRAEENAEKAARRALHESQEAANKIKAANKVANLKKKAKGEAKALLKSNKVSGHAPAPVSSITFDDPNLYILKPHLMSEDWLIEYHVCGRKVAYKKVSEALIYKHTNFQEGYDVYECPYCSHWHYGRKGNPVSPTVQAKRGLRWYKQNHKKANAFIHKIMLEDFV
jgi:hypothetical protein